jgi:hypothetical protein
MFDTIKQVITDAIAGTSAAPYASQYASVIDKVAADVATHISKCSEDVIAQAEAQELDTDEVRRVLVEAGLAVEREPEVVAEAETTGDPMTEQRLTAIEQTLARLSAIAERAERSGYLR